MLAPTGDSQACSLKPPASTSRFCAAVDYNALSIAPKVKCTGNVAATIQSTYISLDLSDLTANGHRNIDTLHPRLALLCSGFKEIVGTGLGGGGYG